MHCLINDVNWLVTENRQKCLLLSDISNSWNTCHTYWVTNRFWCQVIKVCTYKHFANIEILTTSLWNYDKYELQDDPDDNYYDWLLGLNVIPGRQSLFQDDTWINPGKYWIKQSHKSLSCNIRMHILASAGRSLFNSSWKPIYNSLSLK